MIKSMTGYGKAIADTARKKITIEIKSLNSKQFDLSTKIPWLYKEKEPEIRNIVSQMLDRGKIELSVYFDILDDEAIATVNKNVVKSYYNQIKELAGELKIETDSQILSTIIRLPDSLRSEKSELSESEWEILRKKVIEASNILDLYRTEEGKSIEADLRKRISGIIDSLKEVESHEPGRIEKVRARLLTILRDNNGTENIDKNRFEQELIFYLEKFDINEEKVRLLKHCEYFLETVDSKTPNGKILSFIAQEIGREINTIGSKANDAAIQKLVVMMKDELEKIKEQTNNIL